MKRTILRQRYRSSIALALLSPVLHSASVKVPG
jgi:hypothetical protein